MNSQPSEIHGAVDVLAAQAGVDARTEPIEVDVLNWRETPADARLHRLILGDVVLHLHARRGSWACTRVASDGDAKDSPMTFVGVVADALVFAETVPDWLWTLVRVSDPVALDVGHRDGMCGSPSYQGNGVAHWGSFPYHIPDSCAEMVFEAAPQVSTLVLDSVDAAADGPRHNRIDHRV